MTVDILVEGTNVSRSNPVTIYASPTLQKPVIPSMPNFTSISEKVTENSKIRAVVTITAVRVVLDPTSQANANKYADCFQSNQDSVCQNTPFDATEFNEKYSAVAYMGNVNISTDSGTAPKYIGSTCPKTTSCWCHPKSIQLWR